MELLYGVAGSFIVTSLILRFTWWNKLDEMSADTLPADFDERVNRKTPKAGLASTDAAAESSVVFSK